MSMSAANTAAMSKGFRRFRVFLALLALALVVGCASDGGEGVNRSADDPPGPGPDNGKRLLNFSMTVNPNGSIDRTGRGIYAVLLNAQGTPIEATDIDTFSDFIRFDGQNFDWYHRLAEVPNPGFTFVQVGPLSGQATVTSDGKTIDITLDIGESTSFINQFIPANSFTAHAVTTDSAGGQLLGRLIDTLGQGPNVDSNSLQTITVRRGEGATQPVPQSYPFDPLGDEVIHDDLGGDFPYANFDIVRFEVTAR
jgi:hypothetical protein